MPNGRNTDIQTLLFPVETRPVYFRDAGKDLFGHEVTDPTPTYRKVNRFVAVVDVERNYTFAVVADGYRLIKNEEALKLGAQCFLRVFSTPTADGMEVFNVIQPSTRSFCHVDYIFAGHSLEPWQGDKWWPYLRVTNSYNRTKPLRFDLGFCRWICTNGVIFGGEHIVFRYYHTQNQIDMEADFKAEANKLRRLETEFIEHMHNLERFPVPKEHMLALACRAFNIHITEKDFRQPRRREQLVGFKTEIAKLTTRYFKELGPNGYAALNVLSDFAARPCGYISETAMIDPLQKRCGEWTVNFLDAIQQPAFDYAKYLGPFAKAARELDGLETRTE